MAQDSTSTSDAEATAERIRQLNEEILAFGRQAGQSFLDAYETTLKTFAEYQDKAADASQVDWLASMARAQANFTREMANLYTAAARDMLK
jgi:flagellin-like hook-associated protein FlgL